MKANAPNRCRKNCQLPVCGDGIVDSGEECDGPGSGSGSAKIQCTDSCQLAGGGCCEASSGGAGGAALLALCVGALLRRRKQNFT